MSIPNWIWSVLGGVLFAGILAGVATIGESESAPERGLPETEQTEDAPDFSLDTVEGDTFRLRDHRGEVVVLNFWATWCPPCRREIPDFVTLQSDLGDEGLQFVGVALERDAGPPEVRDFADKMNINYPVGLGDGSIARKYGGVRSLPMTFVIGPKGQIQKAIPGMTTEDRIRPILEALLEEMS